MAQQELLPFRNGTRQRFQFVGQQPYTATVTLPFELPRIGYIQDLWIQFRTSGNGVVLGAAGAFTDLGPWNLLRNIRVNTNIGSASIVDLSGYGGFLAHRLAQFAGDMQQAGMGQTVAHADVFAAPLAMGNNQWLLTWRIPINANPWEEFEFGLVNLQSPQTRVTLELTTGNITDPATGPITAITGAFVVGYTYYEVPDPLTFDQPPLAMVRLLEEQQPIGQVGDNIYTIPRQGVLMQTINYVRLNGARSDSFDEYSIRFNKADTIYRRQRQFSRALDRFQQGLNPITGVFTNDLYFANGNIGQGDARDNIDLEELSTVEQILTVSAGAVLGANNNFYNVIRHIAQRLER